MTGRAAAVLYLVLFVLALATALAVRPVEGDSPIGTQVEEDSPGWDCRTMGNRVCGPLPPDPGLSVRGGVQ